MAIVYSYPTTPESDLSGSDLLILSKMNENGRPTKSVTLNSLATYIANNSSGGGGGPFLPLSAGSTVPLTGDLYMAPDGAGPSAGSKNLVFRGIDDNGDELDGARIFTVDSQINPSGQDLYFQTASDAGVLSTYLMVDAFGSVGIGTLNPNRTLDVNGSGNFATSLTVGGNTGVGGALTVSGNLNANLNAFVASNLILTAYAAGVPGTPIYNLAVDNTGGVITVPTTSGLPWLYEYDATDKNFVQGEGPNIAGTGNTGYGVGSLPVLDTGQNNTAFGADAGLRLESSSNNTLIGWEAGRNIDPSGTTCDRNTLIGSSITFGLSSQGDDNTCIGYRAGTSIFTGFQNVFIGVDSGRVNSLGADNVAIGYKSLEIQGGSSRNVAIGSLALTAAQSNSANNTAIGYEAGTAITNGDNNVLLGYGAGRTITSGNNNVVIGYAAQSSSATAQNEITIGNNSHNNIRLPGSLPAFDDDAAAGAGGLLTNMLYQTTGAGVAPLNVAGIVMIKQ